MKGPAGAEFQFNITDRTYPSSFQSRFARRTHDIRLKYVKLRRLHAKECTSPRLVFPTSRHSEKSQGEFPRGIRDIQSERSPVDAHISTVENDVSFGKSLYRVYRNTSRSSGLTLSSLRRKCDFWPIIRVSALTLAAASSAPHKSFA